MRAVAILRHQETQNTDGGTATAGSWENRKLTTIQSDLNSLLSLDPVTGIFTFSSDANITFRAELPFYACDRLQTRLVDADTGVVQILGSSHYIPSSVATIGGVSIIQGLITVSRNQRFVLQSQVQTSRATYGYGIAANFTTEVYTTVEIGVLG